MRLLIFTSLLTAMALVACTGGSNSEATSMTPIANLGGVPRISPTAPPPEIQTQAQIADDDTVDRGEMLYEEHCTSCHGENGEGQSLDNPLEPDEIGRANGPPLNQNGQAWNHDDDQLYQIIHDGGNAFRDISSEMPAFGDVLSDQEIVAVIAFIKTLWTQGQREIQADHTLQTRQQNQ